MSAIHSILKQFWGYPHFRPLQEDIINTVLSGKDCLALMPTGGGKSLCFQVPALAKPGLCLVISPLIALMKDQVENLRKKNITAFSIHSGMNRKEVLNTLAVAGNSNCKFLYVSPERLETKIFQEYLPSLGVNLIAVDEAHCISQWGYDFRPPYSRIATLREELPDVPVLALTASATAEVQQDICEKLLFKKYSVYRQSFQRPELSYSAFNVPSKINKVLEVLAKVEGSAIIYCRSRRRTKEISDILNSNNLPADYYHAGLTPEQRHLKQEAWLRNKIRIVVCTNAFGMGIDKPDVRTVIHCDVPDCLENYYQEAGRAGRDGKRSYAVLLYNQRETTALKASAEQRFPALTQIRKIYQDLMNHLQVASGTGEGNSFELDINSFVKHFALTGTTVAIVLKTLEQEGLLYFNEQVFMPSKVQVTVNRESLGYLEQHHPELEPVVKAVLRSYEGIKDQAVPVQEKNIAATLGISVSETVQRLNKLHSQGMIIYAPQKEKPQVYLVQNRVNAGDLRIDMVQYNKRKLQCIERSETMIRYALTTTECRSVLIGNYFGDKEIKACGICDVCLDLRKKAITQKEFSSIHLRILELAASAQPVGSLLAALEGVSREKAFEVIRFLEAENKITVTAEGTIRSV